jgi:hypothetical protein
MDVKRTTKRLTNEVLILARIAKPKPTNSPQIIRCYSSQLLQSAMFQEQLREIQTAQLEKQLEIHHIEGNITLCGQYSTKI